MNTKIIMITSALFLGILGVASQFLPAEIISEFGVEVNLINKLILQLAGALYLGFALLNWMGKDNLIGGVYSKPVTLGNFIHFAIGAITLIKVMFTSSGLVIIILTIFYTIFALAFAKIVFTHPVKRPINI